MCGNTLQFALYLINLLFTGNQLDLESNKSYVVAIDFGTTYSTYAFSSTQDKDNIYTYYPNQLISTKTPTSILFTADKEFDSFGYEAEERYLKLSEEQLHHEWYFFKRFKMALYKNPGLNTTTTVKDFTSKDFPLIEVFIGGIRYFRDHLFTHFRNRSLFMKISDIHWVLTVPGIWSERAKKFMREAALRAGIDENQLTLALASESAALYCQQNMQDLPSMKAGRKFMVLDCGGGKVDISVHKVYSDNSLKEIHRVTGGPWGSIKVNDAFQEYLIDRFGYKTIQTLSKSDVLDVERSFERLKRTVGNRNKTYYMHIPATLSLDKRLQIHSDDINEFFRKPVNSICNHIKKMISPLSQPDLKTIILVGGFADSLILMAAIKKRFPTKQVIVPGEPSLAIVRGAVNFRHNPSKIKVRKSPYTYGIVSSDGSFDIILQKDQDVKTGTIIWMEYFDQPETHISTILASSESKDPKSITDIGSEVVGQFNIQLPQANHYGFVDVKMIFSGTEIKIEAKADKEELLCAFSFGLP